MNQKGRKKGRESLPHRIAAILYSILLVLSLVPTQAFAEARDEVVDLMDDAVVAIGAQSDDEEVQTLGAESDDGGASAAANDEDEVVIDPDVDEELDDVSLGAQDLPAQNKDLGLFYLAKPVYNAEEHPTELAWVLKFNAPASGYPAPTRITIEYPHVQSTVSGDGRMLYDTLSSSNPVSIVQSLPSGNPGEEIIEEPEEEEITGELLPWQEMQKATNEIWEELDDGVIYPNKDDYYIEQHEDGFDVVFTYGLASTTMDREILVMYWLTINQEWYTDPGVTTIHECGARLYAGDPEGENQGWMQAFEDVEIPYANCSHEDGVYKSLNSSMHRWTCSNCGYFEDSAHNPVQKTTLDPETETEVTKWSCEQCSHPFTRIAYKLTSESTEVLNEEIKGVGETLILPDCKFTPPTPTQHFNMWEVTMPDGTKKLLYPKDGIDLTSDGDLIVTAVWNDEVVYRDANGNAAIVTDYTLVDSRTKDFSPGWYVVKGAVNLGDRYSMVSDGEVNLIMCKGARFITGGITVKGDGVLNIYGQPDGDGIIYTAAYNVIKNYSEFNMYGGTIKGAQSSGVFNSGQFLLAGGVITGNTKGIDQANTPDSQLTICGSPTVKDNERKTSDANGNETGTEKCDIMLPVGKYINVAGDLTGAELWVRTGDSTPRTITSGYGTSAFHNPTDPTSVFFSDYTNMAVKAQTVDGEVQTEKAVLYVKANGKDKEYVKNYTPIKSNTTQVGEGWYAVEESTTITGRLEINNTNAETNIIIPDGVTLTISGGIRTNVCNKAINIWGQDKQSGMILAGVNLGDNASEFRDLLSAYESYVNQGGKDAEVIEQYANSIEPMVNFPSLPSFSNVYFAGIGGNSAGLTTLKVYGGRIIAAGGPYAAGIGGGGGSRDRNGNEREGKLEVYRGTVIAKGGNRGAGIGGGSGGYVCEVKVYGGAVMAMGGNRAAGIGGGSNSCNNATTIFGGNVFARSGSGGAAIGCGSDQSQSGDISISGNAVVTAIAGSWGAGIGCGDDSSASDSYHTGAGNITITGDAYVTARGRDRGAGIGGGDDSYSAGKITIGSGSPTVKATGGNVGGAGIGGGERYDAGNGMGGTVIITESVATDDEGHVVVRVPTVEAYSPGGGAAIGASKSGTHDGDVEIPLTAMVTYADSPDSGKRTCISSEREGKVREHYAKIELCDHKGYTGEDHLRYTSMGGTHQKRCMLCKGDVGQEEPHSYGDDGLCVVCGFGQDYITYIDEKGDQHTRYQNDTVFMSEYFATSAIDNSIAGGWYFANTDNEFPNRMEISGTVNIILRDNCELTFKRGIHIPVGAELNIWAQTGESGCITAGDEKQFQFTGAAAIGGDDGEGMGTFNMHGGILYVKGCTYGAGIGSGRNSGSSGGTINIMRGLVEATGGDLAAGIGGGYKGWVSEINISGGTITAYTGAYQQVTLGSGDNKRVGGTSGAAIGGGANGMAGTVNITGGDIKALAGPYGSGIGAGSNFDNGTAGQEGSWGTVNISGGLVYAESEKYGAGIGGGHYTNGCEVTITGGKLDAVSGGYGAGIGGGNSGAGQDVHVSGGMVHAVSVFGGAGIGSGAWITNTDGDVINLGGIDMAADVVISGGTVIAECENADVSMASGAGIGAGAHGNLRGNVVISGADTQVTAVGGSYAAGIGSGNTAEMSSMNIKKKYLTGKLTLKDDAVLVAASRGSYSNVAVGPLSDQSDSGLVAHIDLYRNAKVITDVEDESKVAVRNDRAKSMLGAYIKVVPCDHAAKEWVSTDNTNHWKQCKYCVCEGSEIGSIVVPHEFVMNTDHRCSCGLQGREIILMPGYGTGKIVRTYVPVGVQYAIPTCTFTAPTEGDVKAQFKEWRLNGFANEPDENARKLEKSTKQPGEIIVIPSRVPDPDDKTDVLEPIILTAIWADPRGIPYTNTEGGTSYAQTYRNMSITTDATNGATLGDLATWYYVDQDVTYNNRVNVQGDVNIILGDTFVVKFNEGIRVSGPNKASLTIWCQKEGNGSLEAYSVSVKQGDDATERRYYAAIGGNTLESSGNITINGGNIKAKAGSSYYDQGGSGIGGGSQAGCGDITINNGTVYAEGCNKFGAGIGNGGSATYNYVEKGNIIINGGTVTAVGGECASGIGGAGYSSTVKSIQILGGVVTSNGGKSAPGIGTGANDSGIYNITIGNNAEVNATGGIGGAGIGSGSKQRSAQNYNSHITIGGKAKVKAYGNTGGAGIGGGEESPSPIVDIEGSAVIEASNGVELGDNDDDASAIGKGKYLSTIYASEINIYHEATVSYKDIIEKPNENGGVDKVKKTLYAAKDERTDWFSEKNTVYVNPCTHKNLADNYQAEYTPTQDKTKHVLSCDYCMVELSEPVPHSYNSRGECSKCGATGIQLSFNSNGGTGSFAPYNVADGDTIELPKCTFKAPEGMRFGGWTIDTAEYSDPSELLAAGAEYTIHGSSVAYAQWISQPRLQVWSASTDLTVQSVAHITVAPNTEDYYEVGSAVTVTAPILIDYDFNGWYKVNSVDANGNVVEFERDSVSTSAAYTFNIEDDTKLVALYKKKSAKVIINVVASNGAEYMYADSPTYQSGSTSVEAELGETFELTAREPDRVLEWRNENNNIIGTGEKITFTVTRAITITLVYKYDGRVGNRVYVKFINDYGQTLTEKMYSIGDRKVTFPSSAPTKMGYEFTGWVFDGTDPAESADDVKDDAGNTISPILNKVKKGTEATLIIRPSYKYVGSPSGSETVQLIFRYVDSGINLLTADSYKTGNVNYGSGITFTAPATAPGGTANKNLVFDHWEDSRGNVMAYGRKIPIVATYDRVYNAVYLNKLTEELSTPVPVVNQYEPVAVREPDTEDGVCKVKGIAGVSIPNGWTLIDYGFVRAEDYRGTIDETTIVLDGYEIFEPYVVKAKEGSTCGVVKYNVAVYDYHDKRITLRAYAHVLNNDTQTVEIVYSDIITTSYSSLIS